VGVGSSRGIGAGVSVGGTISGLGVSVGRGRGVAATSGVGVSVAAGRAVYVGVMVGMEVGVRTGVAVFVGRGVTVGGATSEVGVAKAVGVAKGVTVGRGVLVATGVPAIVGVEVAVRVAVGVLVGRGVGVRVGTLVGERTTMRGEAEGLGVTPSSVGGSSIVGPNVPMAVGVGNLRPSVSGSTRLHATSTSKRNALTESESNRATRLFPERAECELDGFTMCETITHPAWCPPMHPHLTRGQGLGIRNLSCLVPNNASTACKKAVCRSV
jgi:hypothetical protein